MLIISSSGLGVVSTTTFVLLPEKFGFSVSVVIEPKAGISLGCITRLVAVTLSFKPLSNAFIKYIPDLSGKVAFVAGLPTLLITVDEFAHVPLDVWE